jgi:hypothetical protein
MRNKKSCQRFKTLEFTMAVTPTQLRQMGKSMLGIEWNDGHNSIYHVRNLRLACKCASCVDEWTREKKLDEKNMKPFSSYEGEYGGSTPTPVA